jgi:hypothetical protein
MPFVSNDRLIPLFILLYSPVPLRSCLCAEYLLGVECQDVVDVFLCQDIVDTQLV